MVRLTIPGDPPQWRRARVQRTRRGVRHYTDARTVSDEARVAAAAAPHRGAIVGPCVVHIVAVYARPARRPERVPLDAWRTGQRVRLCATPDADNVAKAILDGLTIHDDRPGGLWADDRYADLAGAERWIAAAGEEPHTVVTITPVGWLA